MGENIIDKMQDKAKEKDFIEITDEAPVWCDEEFELCEFYEGINKPKKMQLYKRGVICGIVGAVILCSILLFVNNDNSNNENPAPAKIWSESNIAGAMPKPDFEEVTVSRDTDEEFEFEADNITQIQFDQYVEKCIQEGFVRKIYNTDTYFLAKNNDGYVVRIDYNKSISSARAHIELSEMPEETETSATSFIEHDEQILNNYEVYVTPSGKKYHLSPSCAGKNSFPISTDEAQNSYGPCKKCVK